MLFALYFSKSLIFKPVIVYPGLTWTVLVYRVSEYGFGWFLDSRYCFILIAFTVFENAVLFLSDIFPMPYPILLMPLTTLPEVGLIIYFEGASDRTFLTLEAVIVELGLAFCYSSFNFF